MVLMRIVILFSLKLKDTRFNRKFSPSIFTILQNRYPYFKSHGKYYYKKKRVYWWWVDGLYQICTHNQSKLLKPLHQLMFLIYVAIQNVLIDCVCKDVLDYKLITIKLKFFFLERCSSPNKFCSCAIETMEVLSCNLSHARYFQRELTHACYKPAWLNSR